MHIFEIIQELRSTSSKLAKAEILNAHKDNSTLREFFRLALNPYINFYYRKKITQTMIETSAQIPSSLTLEQAFHELEYSIAGRKVTGHAAQDLIMQILGSVSVMDAEIIKLILQKDPDCGVDTAASKVWPGIAPKYPCLLATAYDKKLVQKHIDFSLNPFVQLKSDGLRCNIIVDENSVVKVFTRSGREMDVFGVFDYFTNYGSGQVYDGELLTVKPNLKFNDRKTSNGICSKAVKGTMSEAESDTLHIVLWDVIPLADFRAGSGKTPYSERFADLTDELPAKGYRHSMIPSVRVSSMEEALEFYSEQRANGEEGAMLKCPTMCWEDARSKKQYKLKAEQTADLEVIGFIEGKGKLEGNLGALCVATSDSKLFVSISGFSLKERSEIYANLVNRPVHYETISNDVTRVNIALPGDSEVKIGSIVEVTYNEKILARDSEVWSLFLPRFGRTRHDKKVANTLEELS